MFGWGSAATGEAEPDAEPAEPAPAAHEPSNTRGSLAQKSHQVDEYAEDYSLAEKTGAASARAHLAEDRSRGVDRKTMTEGPGRVLRQKVQKVQAGVRMSSNALGSGTATPGPQVERVLSGDPRLTLFPPGDERFNACAARAQKTKEMGYEE